MSYKIFTNGCFDIIHIGHIKLLEYCSKLANSRAQGSVVVGLNSDDSIKRLKGEARPIFNENDRKYILENIKFVDEVLIFDEDTPKRLLSVVKPDLIVKSAGAVPDTKEVEGYEVEFCDYIEGYSTTNTINEILSNR